MEIPIRVEQSDGQFVAYVLGNAEWRASHHTWNGAVAALKTVLTAKIAARELATIEVPFDGWLALAGKYRDDPTLVEICEEIYRERDRERDEMFKE